MRIIDAGAIVELLARDLDPDLLSEEELAADPIRSVGASRHVVPSPHRDRVTGDLAVPQAPLLRLLNSVRPFGNNLG